MIRFGLPTVAVLGCTLLFLFGISHFGSVYTFVAIGVILLITGYFCGWGALGVVVTLTLALMFIAGPFIVVPRVQWAESDETPSQWLFHSPDDRGPAQLRAEFGLDDVIGGIDDELERVVALAGWVNSRWSHSGSNTPSSPNPLVILREAAEGASFRCVEYSVVMVGAAQSMGIPARVVGLKTRRAATARSAAGHVVAEVWLDGLEKWVLVDPQLGYVFLSEGVPLNAVELGKALARGPCSVDVLSADGPVAWLQRVRYLLFAGPYLFYFDAQYDNRVFLPEDARAGGGIMLVPKGAPDLQVFQRVFSLSFDYYTSSLAAFYARPENAQ